MKVTKIRTERATHVYPVGIRVEDIKKVFEQDGLDSKMMSSMIAVLEPKHKQTQP